MKKSLILGLSGLTPEDKVKYALKVSTAIAGAATTFASPNPALTTVNTARANLDARLKAISALQISLDSERAALKTDELALDGHLTQLGSYVENIAKGDESLIQLAGFDVADERTPVGPLSAPQNLRGSPASHEGQVNLKWSRVHGAKSYIVECATNPDGPWTPVAVSTRVSCVAANLTSGTKYWFHVRAVGAAGLSGWSDPAVKMAS